MTKLIGGLLVVSLLYSPASIHVKYMAYTLLKNTDMNKIELIAKRNDDSDKEQGLGATERDIDNELTEIENNSKYITELIKEKKKLVSKIETALDLRSYTKTNLTEEQMKGFSNFMSCLNTENQRTQESLGKVDEKKNLTFVKKEILHINSDYNLIYSELKSINEHQLTAIESINKVLETGNSVLAFF